MKQIFVKAALGLKLPREEHPRRYIDDSETVQVNATHYYRKAVIDGDLIELEDPATTAASASKTAAAGKAAKADGE